MFWNRKVLCQFSIFLHGVQRTCSFKPPGPYRATDRTTFYSILIEGALLRYDFTLCVHGMVALIAICESNICRKMENFVYFML